MHECVGLLNRARIHGRQAPERHLSRVIGKQRWQSLPQRLILIDSVEVQARRLKVASSLLTHVQPLLFIAQLRACEILAGHERVLVAGLSAGVLRASSSTDRTVSLKCLRSGVELRLFGVVWVLRQEKSVEKFVSLGDALVNVPLLR